jgi:hypothetical protein
VNIHVCVKPAVPWLREPLKLVRRCVILTLLISSAAGAQSSQANWPKFQNGGSPTTSMGALATTWSPDHNVAWKAAIEGYGQSTPVIFEGQISGRPRKRAAVSVAPLLQMVTRASLIAQESSIDWTSKPGGHWRLFARARAASGQPQS